MTTDGTEAFPRHRDLADLADDLARHRLLAIVRGTDRRATVATALTLVESGIPLVEVSLSGADALAALRQVVADAGDDALIGAGTVVSADDADRAADCGVRFMVTPGNGPGVARCRLLGLPVLVGALTPTEVIAAAPVATAVKLFPASLGGVGHLRALRAPFPDVDFVPVGGIDAELAVDYLRAGARAVGVGSPLVGDAADAGGDLPALVRRAAQFLAAIRSAGDPT